MIQPILVKITSGSKFAVVRYESNLKASKQLSIGKKTIRKYLKSKNRYILNNVTFTFENDTTNLNKSFASHPKAECWSKKNKLKPREVFVSSRKKIWFDCDKCSHDFCSALYSIYKGTWCPYCAVPSRKLCSSDCRECFGRSFASHPKAEYWSEKNKLKPREVFVSSNKKYWFDCDKCSHDFCSALSDISQGRWCPYCAGQKLCSADCRECFDRSFASHPKAEYWSEKNKLKPREVSISNGKKIWFDCDKCSHDFCSALSDISQGRWCPYCAGKKLCSDDCLECFGRSFASHPKAEYWSEKNKLKPREVSISSGKKFWFDCDKCSHEFCSVLYSIHKGRWCPLCKNKTEQKVYEYLITKYETEREIEKMDFTISIGKIQLDIEIDGDQHFKQVSNWQSPEYTLKNDRKKMNNSFTLNKSCIRIYQPDVFDDNIRWKELIDSCVEKELDRKGKPFIYISKRHVEMYEDHVEGYENVCIM